MITVELYESYTYFYYIDFRELMSFCLPIRKHVFQIRRECILIARLITPVGIGKGRVMTWKITLTVKKDCAVVKITAQKRCAMS